MRDGVERDGAVLLPADETVYVDPTFFSILREQYDTTAGPLAQLYVLAHEYGHHVQNLTGVMDQYPKQRHRARQQRRAHGAASRLLRRRLGRRGRRTGRRERHALLQPPTEQQITDALSAAAAVGDDHIQAEAGQVTNPESFTHGSSEQRTRWFDAGRQGGVNACDTFSVPGGRL